MKARKNATDSRAAVTVITEQQIKQVFDEKPLIDEHPNTQQPHVFLFYLHKEAGLIHADSRFINQDSPTPTQQKAPRENTLSVFTIVQCQWTGALQASSSDGSAYSDWRAKAVIVCVTFDHGQKPRLQTMLTSLEMMLRA